MGKMVLTFVVCAFGVLAAPATPVTYHEGTVTIPTYRHNGRETEPPLFGNSTVTGMYPFTTYILPFDGGPKDKTYRAIFVENEYLKITYIPEFGDRIFSLYDKVRRREVFYRNDVIKPAPYNPRNSWPQSGLELTGPHDLHTLTLYGEPFWANKIVKHNDGSVSLVLGELDPVYQMKVNLTATLYPGVAAMEIRVFCYNTRAGRMPQMFWINTAVPATPETRFIYPMSRTVGHTTADIADWPLYNGIDYSLDRNNKNMLGVFGIDSYDNFQGAYQFDNDYGVFRFADRRVVQGMKLWTFGYGPNSKSYEHAYTDNAGPYVELQSGRYVWDGHYEWVAPHTVESWNEWWVPVAGTGGLTTLTRDVALTLNVTPDQAGTNSSVKIALGATRVVPGAKIVVTSHGGDILRASADLDPAQAFVRNVTGVNTGAPGLTQLEVTVTDAAGQILLDYHRPDADPGRKEYTPFTRPLEQQRKAPEDMSVEELTLAGEFRQKELDPAGAARLFEQALKRDAGYSRAHLDLGIQQFIGGRYDSAIEHLLKAIDRDPYSDASYYYLAMSQFALGRTAEAERNLYYIWPPSGYFGAREYTLGRLAFLRGDSTAAVGHFDRALSANSYDLDARLMLALTYRVRGENAKALSELAEAERLDPTSRPVQAERFFLSSDPAAKAELVRLLGGQSQEALGVSVFYRNANRWAEAVRILRLAKENNQDPYATGPEFYYTLAYCERKAGDAGAAASLKKARTAAGNVDRFAYREESEAPLAEAVALDPDDSVARYHLGCLLYYRERPAEAIRQWEAAVAATPQDFSARRALGLAYAEQGLSVEKAAAELARAVELNPAHVRTLNDLSNLYARAGRFDDQLKVLNKALERSPGDDELAEGVLTANLMKGNYDEAERLVRTHQFSPRHRSYELRDKYRVMRYGEGSQAFHRGDYKRALELFESAAKPPVSLGVDDFQGQAAPRLQYYLGRALEASGRAAEARQAYEKGVAGVEHLSGDRDSWSSENFFMVLSLERLGRGEEGARLLKHFEDFARGEADDHSASHRAAARYLLGLLRMREGHGDEAARLFAEAAQARPDRLDIRFELRGDAVPVATAN